MTHFKFTICVDHESPRIERLYITVTVQKYKLNEPN